MGLIKKIIYFIIRIIYVIKKRHLKIGNGTRITPKSVFHGYNKLGCNSYFQGELGRYSYIGNNCIIKGKIGNFCSISHNVTFITGAHPTRQFVSTHPAFYSLAKQCGISFVNDQKFDEHPKNDLSAFSIEIGNDVLIGDGATLIGPLTIGDGAIVGARTVVTKNVEPYSIVVGSPAKVIGKRFNDEQINAIIESGWWNWDYEKLKSSANDFCDVDTFIKNVNK